MPRGAPKNVKDMTAYSTLPQTASDVADALKSHFKGYIEWKGLDEILVALPLRLQQAVRIYYEEWRTTEEVAELMGCSVNSVWVYLRQAREEILARTLVAEIRKLRKEVKDDN